MLPRAQVTAGGGQWGGIRGGVCVGGEGDIEFHAPARLQSAAALRHTMAPVEWIQIWVGPLPSVFNKNFRIFFKKNEDSTNFFLINFKKKK